MRKISVALSEQADKSLLQFMALHQCTITDAIEIALISLHEIKHPIFTPAVTLWQHVKNALHRDAGLTPAEFCSKYAVNIRSFRDLCYRVEKGSAIYGGGDSNKWREKQDGRWFKTHTSYMHYCLKKECGFDLEKWELTDGS